MRHIGSKLGYELLGLFPQEALNRQDVKYLKEKGTREYLEKLVSYWNEKSKFRRFLSYINPFKVHDWGLLAKEAEQVLANKYSVN